jgi:hypothetical protein
LRSDRGLEQLRVATDATSIAEVIRPAIGLREAVAGLTCDGYEIIAENDQGKRKTLYLRSMRTSIASGPRE